MEESGEKPDKRGTIRDWPAEAMMLVVALAFVVPGAMLLWVALFIGCAITFMARRGTFNPRK